MKQLIFIFFIGLYCSVSKANILGADLQNFNPSTTGIDFVTVESPITLGKNNWNFSTFFDYSQKVLPFYQSTPVPGGFAVSEPKNHMLFGHLLLGYGLNSRWDIGMDIGALMEKKSDSSPYLMAHSKVGLSSIRMDTNYLFYEGKKSWAGLHFNFDFLNDTENAYTGTEAGHNYSLFSSFKYMFTSELSAAVNMGYRMRTKGEPVDRSGVTPFSSQLFYSSALKYSLNTINFVFELFGGAPTANVTSATDRALSNLEILLGSQFKIADDLQMHLGLTTELIHGLATPEIRVYTGIQWRPRMKPSESSLKPVLTLSSFPKTKVDKTKILGLGKQDLLFFLGSSDELLPDSQNKLEELVIKLNNYNVKLDILIEGHSDTSGPSVFNKTLSLKRADAVAKIIIERTPIAKANIRVKAYGEEKPLTDNGLSRKNRRVLITLGLP